MAEPFITDELEELLEDITPPPSVEALLALELEGFYSFSDSITPTPTTETAAVTPGRDGTDNSDKNNNRQEIPPTPPQQSPKSNSKKTDVMNQVKDLIGVKEIKGDEIISIDKVWKIINFIGNQRQPPRSKSHKDVPMQMAMTKLLISTSGFKEREIENITAMITEMNGTVTANYTASTTTIVASHGLTEKVILARKRGLPVMTLEWVHAIYDACQNDPYVHGTQDRFKKYTLPLFFNVHFCISGGVSPENQVILTNLILGRGGKVMGEILCYTDILICKNPQETCYRNAMRQGIPIVSPAWVSVAVLNNLIPEFTGFSISGKTTSGPIESINTGIQ